MNTADFCANRADRILDHYGIHVLRNLADEPENETLRDCAAEVRSLSICLISDLRHLCEMSEVNWREIIESSGSVYHDEIAELPPL